MKNRNYVGLLCTLCLFNLEPVFADDGSDLTKIAEMEDGYAAVGGELLLRNENWNWFNKGDDYSFEFIRSRLNLNLTKDNVTIFVQPQFVAMNDLPRSAAMPLPQGPSGMGALYYAHNKDSDPVSAGFHQAYVNINNISDTDIDAKLGRFTYASGLEHMRKEDGQKFNALKSIRLGDRMISSFEWSAFARSFDGGSAHYQSENTFDLTLSHMFPTQGGWEESFNETITDIQISSIAASLPKDSLMKGAEVAMFAYRYSDDRDCTQRVDNSNSATAAAADIDVYMLGAHVVGLLNVGQGQLDYLTWGGYQAGDWYELEQSAFAAAFEVGYQLPSIPLKPWLRIGYFIGSGDEDSGDDEHNTFFQMIPGTRKYQMFPYYDLQNIEYVFAQLFLFMSDNLKVRTDYSINNLMTSKDRWYMGTGATQEDGGTFGYIGRPSMGEEDLSQEASIALIYEPIPSLSFEAFYSHVWSGDVINKIYNNKSNGDYFSVETTFKF